MTGLQPDLNEIQRAAALFLQPGRVAEIRVPKAGRDGTLSGYFNDPSKLAVAARAVDGKAAGIYITLNSVKPALQARANNRIRLRAEQTTSDADIETRVWLLLDLDAKRPAGISSSDSEHEAALDRARLVRDYLTREGWPAPVMADSGNGAHLQYRLPDLANNTANTELVKRCLQVIAALFDDEICQVDQTVFNAARIAKLYGTVARKGDSTHERPHRLTRILEQPEQVYSVSLEQLQQLAAEAVEPPRHDEGQRSANRFDVQRWIGDRGLVIHRGPIPHEGGSKWILDRCPYNSEHRAPDAAIFESAAGKLGFKCFHASCVGQGWKELREFLEPGQKKAERPQEPQAPEPRRRNALKAKSAFEIYNGVHEEPKPLIEGLLFAGLTILAARPKTGKSWLAMQIAIALANDTPLGGKLRVYKPGRVLYIALEEKERRTAPRLRKLTGPSDFLEDIHVVYAIDSLTGGGIVQIDDYLAEFPCVLVVIDTFFAFSRLSERKNVDVLQADYNAINTLRELSEKRSCAILLVHHTRKAVGDSIDTVLGTSGVTAACDAIWTLLRRPGADALLTITGREMEETIYGMHLETGEHFGWKIVSQGADAQLSRERLEIVEFLRSEGAQVPKAIATALKKNPTTVRRLLQMLLQDGYVTKNVETYDLVDGA
jgi:AAA domain